MTRLVSITLALWVILLQPASAAMAPAHIRESMRRLHLQSLHIQRLEAPEYDPVLASALASAPPSTFASAPSSVQAAAALRPKGLERAVARFRLSKRRARRGPAYPAATR